jgi:hypothetical protein
MAYKTPASGYGRSKANLNGPHPFAFFLLLYSKHVPNRWQAKMQAAWLPCNVPKKT